MAVNCLTTCLSLPVPLVLVYWLSQHSAHCSPIAGSSESLCQLGVRVSGGSAPGGIGHWPRSLCPWPPSPCSPGAPSSSCGDEPLPAGLCSCVGQRLVTHSLHNLCPGPPGVALWDHEAVLEIFIPSMTGQEQSLQQEVETRRGFSSDFRHLSRFLPPLPFSPGTDQLPTVLGDTARPGA